MVSTVYLITNKINDKKYVGASEKDHINRWNRHINNKSGCRAICDAIQKHGVDNFVFEVIFQTEDITIDIYEKEIGFIKQYESYGPKGYNLTTGGEGAPGVKFSHTEEFKEKQRLNAKVGSPSWQKRYTPEVRQKLSKSQSKRIKEGFCPRGASKWVIQKDTGEIFETEKPTEYFKGGFKTLWESNIRNKPVSKGKYKGWKLLEIIKL